MIPEDPRHKTSNMLTLRSNLTSERLGTIEDAELKFLVDELEEESETDRDYYFDADTVDMLEADGASPALVALFRRILGSQAQEGVEITWRRV